MGCDSGFLSVSAKDPLVRLQHILDQIDGVEAATRGLKYYRINAREMWDIVQVHLPELRPVIVQMISDLG